MKIKLVKVSFYKWLFYVLPSIELMFFQRQEKSKLVNAIMASPVDTIGVYAAFLFWNIRFNIYIK